MPKKGPEHFDLLGPDDPVGPGAVFPDLGGPVHTEPPPVRPRPRIRVITGSPPPVRDVAPGPVFTVEPPPPRGPRVPAPAAVPSMVPAPPRSSLQRNEGTAPEVAEWSPAAIAAASVLTAAIIGTLAWWAAG